MQFDLKNQNFLGLILAPFLPQWEVHKWSKCIDSCRNQQRQILQLYVHILKGGVKITLLEIFYTPTLQLHLSLAGNNTVQHYKLSTYSDLTLYSNFSNLNLWKPDLILLLFPRYSGFN